jgi:serine/threonine-protein kinase
MNATKSVEEICHLIEEYKLMSSSDYARMRGRWFRPERKEAANPEEFRKWLVLNRYLTEFVAKVLTGRKHAQLVLNQYRLQDQLHSGSMAGGYLAHDALDRPVVLEILSSTSAADPALLASFQQVAMKAREVQHPNVGRILDVGEAHGLHYLVKEYYEGTTLEESLQQRKKVPWLSATRILALALAGLDALHAKGVPAGDLTADCLLLSPAGKAGQGSRTVKILHAGVRRQLFDETAIGRSMKIVQGIPDELELATSSTFHFSDPGAVDPPEDIFRLGVIAYRCLTGQPPGERDAHGRQSAARPVAELAPDVPEMLGEIIDQMIDPDPARRPQKAANVAKSLRVVLASEEHGREVQAEEHIVAPSQKAHAEPAADESEVEEVEEDEEVEEEEEPAPRRRARSREPVEPEGTWGKVVALWEEVRPDLRDLLFLTGGALGVLVLIFLIELLTGIRLMYLGGLVTGMAVSYGVDLFLRYRRERAETTEG